MQYDKRGLKLSVSTYDDVVRANKEVYSLAHESEGLFLPTRLKSVLNTAKENLETIMVLLGSLESSLQDDASAWATDILQAVVECNRSNLAFLAAMDQSSLTAPWLFLIEGNVTADATSTECTTASATGSERVHRCCDVSYFCPDRPVVRRIEVKFKAVDGNNNAWLIVGLHARQTPISELWTDPGFYGFCYKSRGTGKIAIRDRHTEHTVPCLTVEGFDGVEGLVRRCFPDCEKP